MKRLGIITALLMSLAAVSAAVALATITTDPTQAPSGTHYKSGTASCSVAGTTVNCTGYTLAGVGHTNATVDLTATYTATVVCVNNGTHTSDGQHQGSFPKETGPIPLTPDKNGNLPVTPISVSAPTQQDFLAQQTCPNPNWTPTVPGGISLQSFTYTLTFAGFSGAYITITGP
jgi:hypothetical protein